MRFLIYRFTNLLPNTRYWSKLRVLLLKLIGLDIDISSIIHGPIEIMPLKNISNIKVGKKCVINTGIRIAVPFGAKVSFGDYCLVGSRSHFETAMHGIHPDKRREVVVKDINIKDNVYIGVKVIVLQGVTIEKNSLIAAGSVVTKSFESNSFIAGSPAKVKKVIEDS